MFRKTSWARLQNTLSPAIALLLLIWIVPAASEPISYNDPFRAIALRATKPPDPPICCLNPLPSSEPVEDDLLLSFEEWKAKQHQTPENTSSSNSPSNGSNRPGNGIGNGSDPLKVEDTTSPPPVPPEDQQSHPAPVQELPLASSPHFRVPLIDRFNYASLDCSARVHKAHKGAKHPSNVLSSKKDRYMLSPCKTNGEQQFVVIELCEDIRIDTVQMANFEFFSGVFRDFTISVAKTSSEEEWTVAGTYKAKNVRGVQSFHPPTSLHGFYRYLRIDFHSHYGTEYYCPVSLVRVYGLTHLEEWKWELWEAESRAKIETSLKVSQMHRTAETVDSGNSSGETLPAESNDSPSEEMPMPSTPALPINETAGEATPSVTMTTDSPSHSTDTYLSSPLAITNPPDHTISPSSSVPVSTPTSVTSSPSPATSLLPHSTEPRNDATPLSASPHNGTTASTSPTSTVVSRNTSRTSSSIIVTASPLTTSHPFLPMPISGGESIYRMIVNRLVGLEQNHTLYGQYMAQQQHLVREALRRMGEDIGRLEGLEKIQRQAHDRTVLDWEKQRKQWQMEHAQLLQRIDYLSDEIIMEKRLGVAQLCLLLAVLVFMGLTRGSRGPIFEDRRHWRSTLKSLSGDWRRPRLNESRDSRTPREGRPIEISKSAPVRPMTLTAADSGSGLSSENAKTVASAPARLPLATLDTNAPGYQQRPQLNGDEKHRPDHGGNISFVWDNPGTPTHTRSRRISRSRSRTSSQGKGVLLYPGASTPRQSGETRALSNGGGLISTPSKGSRVVGVYSPRPAFTSIRSITSASVPKRPVPLQRFHSSHGPTGSLEYVLGQTWTGSGGGPKSARKWARTAHLHEVKDKRKENESDTGLSYNMSGGSRGGIGDITVLGGDGGDVGDVFGSAGSSRTQGGDLQLERAKLLILRSEDTDADTDGWESASDVGVDSIEGGIM